MAVSFDVIRFVKDSSGTNGATQIIPISFDPKAVIAVSDGQTASNTISSQYQFIYGFSDGINHACIGYTSADAAAVGDTGGIHRNDAIFSRINETANSTEVARASCKFLDKSIQFTWTVNDASATLITLYVFGGTDITNAKVVTTTVGSAGTGTKTYTGLGFNPRGECHSLLGVLSAGLTTANTISTAAIMNIGFSGNPTNKGGNDEAGMCNSIEESAVTMDTYSSISGGLSLIIPNTTTGAIVTSASHLDYIPDGFSYNYTANAGATTIFSYLVIEGGTYFIQIPTTPTSAQIQTVGTTFLVDSRLGLRKQRGLIIFTNGHTAGGSTAHAKTSFGGTDGVRTACMATIDEDAVADADSYRVNDYSSTGQGSVFKTLDGAGALESNANFVNFGENNLYRLDFTVIAAARLLLTISILDEFPPPPNSFGKINTMMDNNITGSIFG